MATSAQQINAKIIQLIKDVELAHQIIHGGPTTVVPTDGGSVRSLANVINQLDADVNAAADSVLAQVLNARDTAVNSATSASGSATGAQASRVAAVTSAAEAAASATAAQTAAQQAEQSRLGAANSLTSVSQLATAAAGSANTATNAATTATSAAGTATTANTEAQAARTQAVNSAGAAAGSATAASNSATAAAGSATTANTRANAADASAQAALASQNAAATSAGNAQTSATNAAASATAAATSASVAVNAPGTSATSTSAVTIGTGAKSFTLAQADKAFLVGQWVYALDTNAPTTRWLHGVISAFTPSTGAMTINVTRANGSGTPATWLVMPGSPAYDSLTLTPSGLVSIPGGASIGARVVVSGTAPSIELIDTDASSADFYVRANANHFYVMADRDSNEATEPNVPLDLDASNDTGWLFGSRIWTAANDGTGSGLDADLVRGLGFSVSGARWGALPVIAGDGTMEVGRVIDFHGAANDTADYGTRIALPDSGALGTLSFTGSTGGYAGISFESSFGARKFLIGTATATSGVHNGSAWDWRFDAAAGNLLVGSNGVWHAANLPFQVAGGNVGLGAAPGNGKLELAVPDTSVAMRMIAGSGRLRYRPYVDATLGAMIESVSTSESGYQPLSLYGSAVRLMSNGGGLSIIATGHAAFGVAPLASVPLMVHTGANRNVAVMDHTNMATLAAISDAGSSQPLRVIGNTLVLSGDGSNEAMRVDSNQHLIIGRTTNSGLGHLQVAGNVDVAPAAGAARAYLRGSAGNPAYLELGANNVAAGAGLSILYDNLLNAYFYNRQAASVLIGTNNATRLTIGPSGEASFGGSPIAGYALDVSGMMSVRRGAGASAYIEIAGNGRSIGSASMVYGQDNAGNGYVWNRENGPVIFGANSISHIELTTAGAFVPYSNAIQNIGAPNNRWASLFATAVSDGDVATGSMVDSFSGMLRIAQGSNWNALQLRPGGIAGLTILADGRVYGSHLHNNPNSVSGSTQYIASGNYTPVGQGAGGSPSAPTGITFHPAQWIRVGMVCVVSGAISATAAQANQQCFVQFSLPLGSYFNDSSFLSGTCASAANTVNAARGAVVGANSGVNGLARMEFISGSTGGVASKIHYTFTYSVAGNPV